MKRSIRLVKRIKVCIWFVKYFKVEIVWACLLAFKVSIYCCLCRLLRYIYYTGWYPDKDTLLIIVQVYCRYKLLYPNIWIFSIIWQIHDTHLPPSPPPDTRQFFKTYCWNWNSLKLKSILGFIPAFSLTWGLGVRLLEVCVCVCARLCVCLR